MSSRPHILFVSAFRTPFIEEDLKFLTKEFRVTTCIGNGLNQIIGVVLGTIRSDIVFCWFASVYAAIAILCAKCLGKKSVVVIGGVDVAAEPEYKYGLWLSPWKAALVRKAIKSASKVLVVDESLRKETVDRVQFDGRNIETVPTGYDAARWYPSGPKQQSVLTVAAIQSEGRLFMKGIDILFEAARRLPRVAFVLVGFDAQKFPALVPPPNLTIVGTTEQSELLSYYRRAKIYCQPSRREGLSNTLCEAMLCGCIPVATDVGGSANAVGKSGAVVGANDPDALAAGIKRAMRMKQAGGIKARRRIITLFPKKQREERLTELIRILTQ